MQHRPDYYIKQYITEWADCNNVVIALYEATNKEIQIGIVEVKLFKLGSKRTGEAYIWNLYLNTDKRGVGYGRVLLKAALDLAKTHGCHTAILEWDRRDSPQWVFDWYCRQCFDEKEFGNGYALLQKEL